MRAVIVESVTASPPSAKTPSASVPRGIEIEAEETVESLPLTATALNVPAPSTATSCTSEFSATAMPVSCEESAAASLTVRPSTVEFSAET